MYIKSQRCRFPDSQPREVPSLSDTRWLCRHDACMTLLTTLPAVIDVLEDLTLLHGTCFVIHLCIFKFLLRICAETIVILQGGLKLWIRPYNPSKAVCRWLKRPELPLVDEVWKDIYKEAEDIVQAADIPQI